MSGIEEGEEKDKERDTEREKEREKEKEKEKEKEREKERGKERERERGIDPCQSTVRNPCPEERHRPRLLLSTCLLAAQLLRRRQYLPNVNGW